MSYQLVAAGGLLSSDLGHSSVRNAAQAVVQQRATVLRQQAPASLLHCRAAVGAVSDISIDCATRQLCVLLWRLLVSLQAALVQRWSQLDPGARQGVKQATLTALSSQVRTHSAQVVLAATRGSSSRGSCPSKAERERKELTCQGSPCMQACVASSASRQIKSQ